MINRNAATTTAASIATTIPTIRTDFCRSIIRVKDAYIQPN